MRPRDWILITLLFIIAIICVRLGFWQLDRRQERLSRNNWVESQLSQPPIIFGDEVISPEEWEYRKVDIKGDFQNEFTIALRNRSYADQPGVHVATPLKTNTEGKAVLVDRGWISNEDYIADGLEPFRQIKSERFVGIVRLSQPEPTISFLADPTREPGAPPRTEWRVLNVERIQEQVPFDLHPFIVVMSETIDTAQTMPIPNTLIDLSQGPHLSYAIQWFGFAGVAGVGGTAWWRKQVSRKDEIKDESSTR
jgi:surfeit locus 1 family protein